MIRIQALTDEGVRPSFWLGRRKYTLFKIKADGYWYVRFRIGPKPTERSTGTTDPEEAIRFAHNIIREKRELGFTRASMAKALTQPTANDSDVRGLPEAFEVEGYCYRVERREDRASWFVRFYGLNGKQVTYSTGQINRELAKARAAGFIEGYRKGLIANEEAR